MRTNIVENAKNDLLQTLKEGMTVYTILRHVCEAGMVRDISLLIFVNNEPRYFNRAASVILGLEHSANNGIRVKGRGMDMGAHLVRSLSHALFGKEDALKQRWL